MARKKYVTVFMVQKHAWFYNDEFFMVVDSEPVQTFRDRARAEQYRAEVERAARRSDPMACNPFSLNGVELDAVTSLGEDDLARRVEEIGLEPPEDGHWHNWWYEKAEEFTPDQLEAVWGLCDRVQLFEVVEDRVEVRE
jgi:hypothetical protein